MENKTNLGNPGKAVPETDAPVVPASVDEYRIQMFRELAFTELEATKLAQATDRSRIKDRSGKEKVYELPLHPSKVRKALEKGCGHKLAVHIFT